MHPFRIPGLLALLAPLTACSVGLEDLGRAGGPGGDEGGGGGAPIDVTATEVDCASVTPDLEIDIVERDFAPRDAVVPTAGVVRWTNRDAAPHTVTDSVPGHPEAGAIFDSGELAPGDTWCLEVDGTGTVTYFCAVHPTTMRDATLKLGPAVPGAGDDGGVIGGGAD